MTLRVIRKGFLLLFAALLLNACDSDQVEDTEFSIQRNYFLQSIELVESAGVQLQSPGLSRQEIEQAMQQMDQGLGQAFKVERKFLRTLEVRLPKFYNELFIAGVKQYRLGMESSNRQQQIDGLNLLGKWQQYWEQEKSAIQQKLVDFND
jgi:hypothetical protein